MVTFRFRRGTSLEWEAKNPVLQDGEPGIESDTQKFKVGDGVTRWTQLPYNSEETLELTPDELDDVVDEVLLNLELPDLVLLWENAKA